MEWTEFNTTKPSNSGDKIVFILDDGCSAGVAMVVDADENGGTQILDAEDASEIKDTWLAGAIWAKLPDEYPIAFMEQTEADWC